MTYTRSYPNDFTQNGTKVKKGFENDDAELKRIYGLFDSVGAISLAGTKRQSVLYASTNNGEPNYLTASGLNVSLDGSAINVLLAFAYGFDAKGAVDFLEKIATLVSNAWTLPGNSTAYLYIDRDISTNIISYGYSALKDVYQKTAPTATLDQHWYDTNSCQMLRYNGSAWETKQRVFVAKVVTDATTATLAAYPLRTRATQEADVSLVANTLESEYKNYLLLEIYPVGSVYMSVLTTSPATLFGGTWAQIKDAFLLSCGDSYANGETGGEATHTLTVDEMPSHSHVETVSSRDNGGDSFNGIYPSSCNNPIQQTNAPYTTSDRGGNAAHNNMPPYLAIYVWKRTA